MTQLTILTGASRGMGLAEGLALKRLQPSLEFVHHSFGLRQIGLPLDEGGAVFVCERG